MKSLIDGKRGNMSSLFLFQHPFDQLTALSQHAYESHVPIPIKYMHQERELDEPTAHELSESYYWLAFEVHSITTSSENPHKNKHQRTVVSVCLIGRF